MGSCGVAVLIYTDAVLKCRQVGGTRDLFCLEQSLLKQLRKLLAQLLAKTDGIADAFRERTAVGSPCAAVNIVWRVTVTPGGAVRESVGTVASTSSACGNLAQTWRMVSCLHASDRSSVLSKSKETARTTAIAVVAGRVGVELFLSVPTCIDTFHTHPSLQQYHSQPFDNYKSSTISGIGSYLTQRPPDNISD